MNYHELPAEYGKIRKTRSRASAAAKRVSRQPIIGSAAARYGCKFKRQSDTMSTKRKLSVRASIASMAGNDHAIVADQYRVHETKLRDRTCDLPDLILGMRLSIARMRDQPVEWPMFEARRKRGCHVDYGVLRWGIEPRSARCASPSKGNVL